MSGADDISWTTVVTAGATTYVLGKTDYIVSVQGATGAVAITLPAPTGLTGREYVLQKDAAAQTVTITPASGNVDGGASVTLASGAVHARRLFCDGTGWWSGASF